MDGAITAEASRAGRERLLSLPREPMFLADWDRALFLHFEVNPARLQPHLPFELDLFENKRAFVSLVAFTMRRMRPRFGGKLGTAVFHPIATHAFLNVRTYVRHKDEPGIHFLAEWLPNRLACILGPSVFGLPYQFGKLDYRHDHELGEFSGIVRMASGRESLKYSGAAKIPMETEVCAAHSLDAFLLERYTAYTARRNRLGFFRVWHEPWPVSRVTVNIHKNDLLHCTPGGADWATDAHLVAAHYSPGAQDVWMGWPHRIRGRNAPINSCLN